jgi:small multidrug resistance pump
VGPGALLVVAIGSEVVATTALRMSDGFTRPLPVAVLVVGYTISLYLLSVVVRDLSIGLTYAIWAGAGTALIAVIGVVLFDETLTLASLAGIALVIAGVILINASALS